MATLFVATHPERAIALVVSARAPAGTTRRTTPSRPTQSLEAEMAFWDAIGTSCGARSSPRKYLEEAFAPSADDAAAVAWLADYMRNAASPGAVNAFSRMNAGIDVRSALPAIHVPTLVLARDDDLDVPMLETKWMAEQIRGARFVSFPGNEHYIFFGNQGELLDEIERFVAEVRGDEADLDRVLATVMFTESSTRPRPRRSWAKGMGDLVERHHGLVRAMLGRFRGRRSTPPATASWPPSTVQRGPCAAPRRSARRSRSSGSRSEPASIPARSSRSQGRSAGSP